MYLFIFIFLTIVFISWISTKEMLVSLFNMFRSEVNLIHEREGLEKDIRQHTEITYKNHIQKLSELYRFAEFGKLSSGIFHDLMNPLSAIALNIEQLALYSSTLQKDRDMLAQTLSVTHRAQQMVTGLQKQVKPHAVHSLFNVREEVQQAGMLFAFKLREQNICFDMHIDSLVIMYGNPITFQRIITNLVSNAIDSFEYKSFKNSQNRILITFSKNKEAATLTITDNGCGIAPSLQNTIFTALFTTKSLTKGTGLGLSTTKDIIEKEYRGTITVESTPDHGTTFTVIFPTSFSDLN